MDELVRQIFTLYGPLGLGWVFFFWERTTSVRRDEKRWEQELARTERWAVLLEGMKNALEKALEKL